MSLPSGAMFCDLRCVHASAPREEMDGARSCMTFTAIWCSLYGRHVMKAQKCRDRQEKGSGKLSADS